jgi:hypothetical protein
METIKEYKETIDLFGKKREVTITIKTEFDNDYYNSIQDGIDLTEYKDEEKKDLILDIEEGNLSVDIIFVEVKCDLFRGGDYLGGCFKRDWVESHFETVDYYDMVQNAIDDYRTNAKKYKDFFEA